MQNWYAFLEKAGPVGITIVICSVVALFIILERIWTYRALRVKDARLFHRMRKRALEGGYAQAAALAKKERHPMAVALTEVMARLEGNGRQASRADLEKTFGHTAAREVRRMERYLPTLFLISSVSPLLGLFGTVTGMIKAFQAIQNLGGKVNASVLAGGIWEAMLTTALGLGVAIPAMVAHNYLQGKVHGVVAEMKEETGEFLDELEDAGLLSLPVAGRSGKVRSINGSNQEVG